MSATAEVPAGELFLGVRKWLLQAFAAAGAQLDMGTQLFSTFLRAELPPPEMTAATPVAHERIMFLPRVVGAWAVLPSAFDQHSTH